MRELAYVRRKKRTQDYGGRHQRIRRSLEDAVNAGLAKCARCGEPIKPGTEWDLDHADMRDNGARPLWWHTTRSRCTRAWLRAAANAGQTGRDGRRLVGRLP